MRAIGSLITLFALVGCASVPEDSGERSISNGVEVASSVELCKTKIADLQARLGQPSRDGRLGKVRVVTWIVEWDPLTKYLGVMTDDTGTVVDVYWNLPSEVQWSPTNRCQ
jgi:hypothetical protein